MDYHSRARSRQKLNTEQPTANVAPSAVNGKNGPRGPQAVVLERARVMSKVILINDLPNCL